MKRSVFLGLVLALFAGNAFGEGSTLQFSSGDKPVALIELFTSEGCSSCPPADRYLSTLKADDGLWDEFVPVAFHVDYWDYLGWDDRFASSTYSTRQRIYAEEGGVRVVYTPGFFSDGREWRRWRTTPRPARDDRAHGVLEADVKAKTVDIRWSGDTDAAIPLAHMALLGMSLSSSVGAGENRGRNLEHDFVVLDLQTIPLNVVASGFAATTDIPESEVKADQRALAVWVTDGKSQAPLQATGGFLNF